MGNAVLIILSIIIPFTLLIRPLIECKGKSVRVLFSNYHYELLLVVILICGALLRSVNLVTAPAGLNQDEASIGYEAYSILTSGADRNGVPFPVHLISWGSGQNALYAYLCIPFIKIFGLSVLTVRLPMCILGCVSVYVFSLILKLSTTKNFGLIGH